MVRRIKLIPLSISIEPLDSEDEKEEWRRQVLKGHEETTQLATQVLKESRHVRSVLETSCDEIKNVINVWSDYEDRYDSAIKRLSDRIEKSLECDRRSKKIRTLKSSLLNVRKFHPSRGREKSISSKSGISFGSR